jgi:hypothetical protein
MWGTRLEARTIAPISPTDGSDSTDDTSGGDRTVAPLDTTATLNRGATASRVEPSRWRRCIPQCDVETLPDRGRSPSERQKRHRRVSHVEQAIDGRTAGTHAAGELAGTDAAVAHALADLARDDALRRDRRGFLEESLQLEGLVEQTADVPLVQRRCPFSRARRFAPSLRRSVPKMVHRITPTEVRRATRTGRTCASIPAPRRSGRRGPLGRGAHLFLHAALPACRPPAWSPTAAAEARGDGGGRLGGGTPALV